MKKTNKALITLKLHVSLTTGGKIVKRQTSAGEDLFLLINGEYYQPSWMWYKCNSNDLSSSVGLEDSHLEGADIEMVDFNAAMKPIKSKKKPKKLAV